MLLPEFATLVRFYTKTDSTTFTDQEILLFANNCLDDLAIKINSVQPGIFGAIETRTLQAGVREYNLPTDNFVSLSKLEACFDGTNWVPVKEINLNFMDTCTNEASIVSHFDNSAPKYFIFRGSLWILSGTISQTVTDGLKLWTMQRPQRLLNLTDNVDISTPRDNVSVALPFDYHELLARLVSIAWKGAKDTPAPLSPFEVNFANDLNTKLEAFREPNFSRAFPVIPTVSTWSDL